MICDDISVCELVGGGEDEVDPHENECSEFARDRVACCFDELSVVRGSGNWQWNSERWLQSLGSAVDALVYAESNEVRRALASILSEGFCGFAVRLGEVGR